MNLETYLKQATRGIWGKRKQDAILELRGNIEARTWTLEHQGKTQAEALEIALHELGDARVVNTGMTQVHTMPGMMRNVLLAGLLSSFIVIAFNPGQAQVTVINASDNDSRTAQFPETTDAWISMGSLKANLEAAGIVVNGKPQKPVAAKFEPLESHQPNPTPTLEFTFPGAKQPTKLQALVGRAISSDGRFDSKKKYAIRNFSKDAKPGEVYLDIHSLMYVFQDSGLPVSLRGLRNPTVMVGTTNFQVGDDTTPMQAFNTHVGLAYQLFVQQMKLNIGSYTSPRWGTSKTYLHVLRVNDKPGSVYALATISPTGHEITLDVTLLVMNGQALEFLSEWKTLQFVKTKTGFEQDLKTTKRQGMLAYLNSKQNTGLGSVQQPANAVLMKLTGFFAPANRGEVVMPNKPRSSAIK
jgi:hypothetical protein